MKPSTEIETLKLFTFKCEISQSELSGLISQTRKGKNPKSAYQLALRHIKLLEGDDLIRLKTTEVSRHGKPAKIYTITFLGLVVVLSECEDAYKNIDAVAQTHSDLIPLVFGKWQLFETQGVKKTVIDNVKLASKTLALNPLWVTKMQAYAKLIEMEQRKKERRKQGKQDIRKLFKDTFGSEASAKLKDLEQIENSFSSAIKEIPDPRRDFLDIVFAIAPNKSYNLETKSILQFFQALKGDAEITAYITEELEKLSKEYATYLKNIDDWRKWFEV